MVRIPIVAMAAILVPVSAAFCALLFFVVAEAAGARLFATAPPSNVAEAAALGDAARVVAFIGSGQSPDARWPVRRGLLDSQKPVRVTALQAAILSRSPEIAGLLLRHGAHVEHGESLACLAQADAIDRELPPATFGAAPAEYYRGPMIRGTEALARCGLEAD
jgi:hypothetical protein